MLFIYQNITFCNYSSINTCRLLKRRKNVLKMVQNTIYFLNDLEKDSGPSKTAPINSWFSKTFSARKKGSFDRLHDEIPPLVEDIVSWIEAHGKQLSNHD